MEIKLACDEVVALCNSADEMRRRLGKVHAEPMSGLTLRGGRDDQWNGLKKELKWRDQA